MNTFITICRWHCRRLLFLGVIPWLLANLHTADGAAPRADADCGHLSELIAGAGEGMQSEQRNTLRNEGMAAGHELQKAPVGSESVTNAASLSRLASLLADTVWEWGNGDERIQFAKDGWIEHPGWQQRGLATSWQAIDEHTVLLSIVEGREVDRLAVLVFSPDFKEYTGYSFHGGEVFMPCKRVQEGDGSSGSAGAAQESQLDRSGWRTYRPVSGRPFHPVSAEGTNRTSYPWVVFGKVGPRSCHRGRACGVSSGRTKREVSRSAGFHANRIGLNRRTGSWRACAVIPWQFPERGITRLSCQSMTRTGS